MTKKIIKKYYRPKSKWAANISEFSTESNTINPGTFQYNATLVQNPSQTNLGVSQLYTVKNFEINFEFDMISGSIDDLECLCAYIMYRPQGMVLSVNFNIDHPEYVMAYQFYGSPQPDAPNYGVKKIKTRLSRKLNTGDSIILLIKGFNSSQAATVKFGIQGLVRWWTKAN